MKRDNQTRKAIEYEIRIQLMRELHDTLAHLRTIGATAEEVLTEDPSMWKELIEQLVPDLNEVVRKVKEIVAPEPLRKEKLIAESVDRFISEIHKVANKYRSPLREIIVHATVDDVSLLTPRQYVHIIKIIENCVANAALHARPPKINVELKKQVDGNTILKVQDNGTGDERLNDIHNFVSELRELGILEHQGLAKILHESNKLSIEPLVTSSEEKGTTFIFNIPRGVQAHQH